MVSAVSSSLAGLQDAQSRLAKAADRISKATQETGTPGANAGNQSLPIHLDEELVNTKLSAISYKANAKVLKAQLDTEQKLLDILA